MVKNRFFCCFRISKKQIIIKSQKTNKLYLRNWNPWSLIDENDWNSKIPLTECPRYSTIDPDEASSKEFNDLRRYLNVVANDLYDIERSTNIIEPTAPHRKMGLYFKFNKDYSQICLYRQNNENSENFGHSREVGTYIWTKKSLKMYESEFWKEYYCCQKP
jgi:hypothetical protein